MALQHVRAAQTKAATSDPLGRFILTIIATDIGINGEPAYTSLRTIAERAGCHYNTAHAWVKRLAKAGDLVAERSGKYTLYTLGCDNDCDNDDTDCHTPDSDNNPPAVTMPTDIVTPQAVTIAPPSTATDDRLSQLGEKLSQLGEKLSQLEQTLSQLAAHIVTPQTVTKDNERKTKEEREEREDPPKPPRLRFPVELESAAFTEVWSDWLNANRKLGRPLTHEAKQYQLDEMAAWGLQDAVQGLRNAIAGGWKKPYQPDRKGSTPTVPDPETRVAQVY